VVRVLGNVLLMFGVLIVLLIEDERFGLAMTALAALLFVALPSWPYSRGWGWYPSGGLAVLLLIVLYLIAAGHL
jgi:hypothetical protein